MDGLCQLTNRTQVEIPAPDYEGAPSLPPVDYNQNAQQPVTKSYIRNNMSDAMKEISKDINFRGKQDRQQRPEFLAKQHQLKSSAAKKQQQKDHEENNELFAKLKSRSQAIDNDERQKEEEAQRPEFMKVKLKSGPNTPIASS